MIVLDSSFLIGFYNERDVNHGAASALMQRFLDGEWGGGLLLEYVFLDVVTVLIARRDLTLASHTMRIEMARTGAKSMSWSRVLGATRPAIYMRRWFPTAMKACCEAPPCSRMARRGYRMLRRGQSVDVTEGGKVQVSVAPLSADEIAAALDGIG